MAVVLFEILMLGKSPYESRSTDSDNVLDAIAAARPDLSVEREERAQSAI